jgi:hypothetical protein
MIRASSTCISLLVCLAVSCMAIVPSVAGADPGPPPGIPAAPSSDIAQHRLERDAADAASDSARGTADAARTSAWQEAIDSANGPHLDEVTEPRALAAIVGTIWFILAARAQWRRRRRNAMRTR